MSLPPLHTNNGVSPADLLVSAIEERRPIVLILGQDAWAESNDGDTVLAKAFDRLGHNGSSRSGWSALLGARAVPGEFYDWLAERFTRRVHPRSIEVLTELPWSAVFTSSLDPTLKGLLEGGREPAMILTANEAPPAARSKARPPLYHLFSRAGEHDPAALPPANRRELNIRRINHALPLLRRVLETATTLGLVVVDGFASGRDWLKIDDLLGIIGDAAPHQVMWFGGRPRTGEEIVDEFDAAVESNRIVVDSRRFGTLVAELRALDRLPEPMLPDAEAPGLVSLNDGRSLETTPEERLRVEAVAAIVDDSWTDFLAPLGEDSEYAAFRRFHGAVEGPRLLVEGVRRGFAIERDFESELWRRISSTIADHAKAETPIVVEGQSGTGKSVALARIAVHARERTRTPVLYAIGRIPRSQEVSKFCELADSAGAASTLIVCDANREVDDYYELLSAMRSLGRRVVVLGSKYRGEESTGTSPYISVEAPPWLSDNERGELQKLLERYFEIPDRSVLATAHILAFLYRHLPASRARIGDGLSAEAQSAVRTIGRLSQSVDPITLLHQRLIDAGCVGGARRPRQERSTSDSEDAAERLIDYVMIAGYLNCEVPVNLLIRAVTKPGHDVDFRLFQNLDLFRWRSMTSNDDDLLVGPRLTLEAEVLCRHRFGGADAESGRLLELIESVRDSGIDSRRDERRFLLDLLGQLGPDGLRAKRYQHAYVEIGRTLTKLRITYGISDAGLMIQESTFRRYAVRYQKLNESCCLSLLEEARDVVQLALDGVADGSIEAARRTKDSLLVERATIYGYLARNRAEANAPVEDIWSAYIAARTAIRKAVSVTNAYYPLDVGLWTPSDLLSSDTLAELQQADLKADIYATLDQVEPAYLPPQQREKFRLRKVRVGTTLGDEHLTDHAFSELEESGSTAGYFLRARQYISEVSRYADTIDRPEDVTAAQQSAEFLSSHFETIRDDQRCLRLLLECRWIMETKRWPFRGRRQPVPSDDAVRRELLELVRELNAVPGSAAQHLPRYLEAMLTWLADDEQLAIKLFRALDRDTDHEFGGRVISRHLITGADGIPCRFQGRVEQDRGSGHWRVWVDSIRRHVDLMSRHFPQDHITYGSTIRNFSISFNFIGPIAEPIR